MSKSLFTVIFLALHETCLGQTFTGTSKDKDILTNRDEFFSRNQLSTYSSISTDISLHEDITSPAILIESSGPNTAHCYVFIGYELYNKDWFDPKSKIYLYNPEGGYEESVMFNDFNTKFTHAYQ